MDFAMYLMEEAGVAVVPGSGFLADGFIRISYASSEEDLKNACTAIGEAVSKLHALEARSDPEGFESNAKDKQKPA